MERLSFFTLAFLTCFSAIFLLSPSPYHALSLSKLSSKPLYSHSKDGVTWKSELFDQENFYHWLRKNYFCKTRSYSERKPSVDARYFIAVSVNTSKHHFSVSSRYLSFSISPRKVTGPFGIDWSVSKLQVSVWCHNGVRPCAVATGKVNWKQEARPNGPFSLTTPLCIYDHTFSFFGSELKGQSSNKTMPASM